MIPMDVTPNVTPNITLTNNSPTRTDVGGFNVTPNVLWNFPLGVEARPDLLRLYSRSDTAPSRAAPMNTPDPRMVCALRETWC